MKQTSPIANTANASVTRNCPPVKNGRKASAITLLKNRMGDETGCASITEGKRIRNLPASSLRGSNVLEALVVRWAVWMSVQLGALDCWRKIAIRLSMGISKAMGSARFIATAARLLLCAALCTAKSQGFQTTGKLVCILGPNVSTSPGKNEKGTYRLVLEVKGYVYRCVEKRQGLLRRRRFRERDWPLGRPVQVLVDEGRGEVYMQDQSKNRKEVVLQCAERVSRENWIGCVTEH